MINTRTLPLSPGMLEEQQPKDHGGHRASLNGQIQNESDFETITIAEYSHLGPVTAAVGEQACQIMGKPFTLIIQVSHHGKLEFWVSIRYQHRLPLGIEFLACWLRCTTRIHG